MTHTDDFTAILPDIINNPKSKNATVNLAASTVSWNEAIAAFEKATGKTFEKKIIPLADLEKEIKANPNPFATVVQQLKLILGRGPHTKAEQGEYSKRHFTTFEEYVSSLFKK